MPERYAVIAEETMTVDNIVLWDSVTPWSPPPNHIAVVIGAQWCDIGYTYDPATGTFSPPTA